VYRHADPMPEYTSTDCRVGYHERCKERRIVPNCACWCHVENDADDGSEEDP
jgi:hypothetical protein